jgi:hypothetical protein
MTMNQPIPANLIMGDDGDTEVLCEHGVGHSQQVHTCDGCCFRLPLAAHPLMLPRGWEPK